MAHCVSVAESRDDLQGPVGLSPPLLLMRRLSISRIDTAFESSLTLARLYFDYGLLVNLMWARMSCRCDSRAEGVRIGRSTRTLRKRRRFHG